MMKLLAPIVLILGFSAALYKTQEIWSHEAYKARYPDVKKT